PHAVSPAVERPARRRRYRGGRWTSTLSDLHPLLPRRAPALRLTLSPERARQLMRDENAGLAASWDDYARALLPLALSPGDQLELGEDLEQFIASRRGAIADRVVAAYDGGGPAGHGPAGGSAAVTRQGYHLLDRRHGPAYSGPPVNPVDEVDHGKTLGRAGCSPRPSQAGPCGARVPGRPTRSARSRWWAARS